MSSTYWIYGTHAVTYALQNPDRVIHQLLYSASTDLGKLPLADLNIKMFLTDKQTFTKILGVDAVHQGIAVQVSPLPPMILEDLKNNDEGNQLVMILDQVSDPHNVGAILRTCAVFGIKALILTDRNAPGESAILAKTACGALEIVPMVRVTNLANALTILKKIGFWTVGLAEKGDQTLSQVNWKGKMAIIMGAEGDGIRSLTQKHCDFLTRLETSPDFTTLNVSNAAAIALYEGFKGQRP
ncbi:MAG: 23S rRNA (guanosine(2251)-2'-O)-methyltransferase RlmB [Alphaproteobacteria bacterium]|nr:23S rRNA (guanosine(2251)-2'-O)-methyltransferase RlmB [Alphaproteobacteria bacterium]